MKTSLIVTAFMAAASLAVSSFAQQTATSPVTGGKASNAGQVPVPANPAGGTGASAPTGQPNAADMTKSFTYTSEMEPVPGMKTAVREVIKIADNNHMSLEWYENQGGQEKKTMEINYTKKK